MLNRAGELGIGKNDRRFPVRSGARWGTSDWHGLILGGCVDCAGRMGLGFRPGPETHVLDTLGVQIPRCEDLTRTLPLTSEADIRMPALTCWTTWCP